MGGGSVLGTMSESIGTAEAKPIRPKVMVKTVFANILKIEVKNERMSGMAMGRGA